MLKTIKEIGDKYGYTGVWRVLYCIIAFAVYPVAWIYGVVKAVIAIILRKN